MTTATFEKRRQQPQIHSLIFCLTGWVKMWKMMDSDAEGDVFQMEMKHLSVVL